MTRAVCGIVHGCERSRFHPSVGGHWMELVNGLSLLWEKAQNKKGRTHTQTKFHCARKLQHSFFVTPTFHANTRFHPSSTNSKNRTTSHGNGCSSSNNKQAHVCTQFLDVFDTLHPLCFCWSCVADERYRIRHDELVQNTKAKAARPSMRQTWTTWSSRRNAYWV